LTWGVVALVAAGVSLLLVVVGDIGLTGVLLSFFVLVASLGFIFPNAAALALGGIDTGVAGSASALLGVLQFSIGAVAAPLVGLGGATTAVPMAGAIAAFTIAALVVFVVFCRPAQANA
jgi:DHA1 family bicyclomycin/chloramphenicol resistance-like MFS transporter